MARNAKAKLDKGDAAAQAVLDALMSSAPTDRYVVFMGFCPHADINNRLDVEWRKQGNCTFTFYDSEHQMERFRTISVGDLLVLNKIQIYGKTMRLYGHGRVTALENDDKGDRVLRMTWSDQDAQIDVPLMGCNETVNVKDIERVDDVMPPEFWSWLGENRP